ncbi:hypothetical protein C2G38_2141905 [Gigaspora rosea]|uniref:Uncharacterized protein n=1 Tax=Gigaspora rosea TaxID=44941 RepID=A0A397VHU9_9GLOM|nr:hypothetical protein C2G38_2141905 [Gigaspora rosea]
MNIIYLLLNPNKIILLTWTEIYPMLNNPSFKPEERDAIHAYFTKNVHLMSLANATLRSCLTEEEKCVYLKGLIPESGIYPMLNNPSFTPEERNAIHAYFTKNVHLVSSANATLRVCSTEEEKCVYLKGLIPESEIYPMLNNPSFTPEERNAIHAYFTKNVHLVSSANDNLRVCTTEEEKCVYLKGLIPESEIYPVLNNPSFTPEERGTIRAYFTKHDYLVSSANATLRVCSTEEKKCAYLKGLISKSGIFSIK